MAELVVGPIMEKIINACSDYLEEQVQWQTGMKKELESLRENHPKIQAVVLAANQAQISDQNHPINKWIWELRDALDEVNDALDLFEYMKHQEQLKNKNMEETKKRTASSSNTSFLFENSVKVAQGALKIDPNLKRLEEVVQKLDKISAGVTNFLHLLDIVKQEQKEQEVDFYKTRETEYLPKNDLIGRLKKERVMEWLRNPSHDDQTNLYRNISLLCIKGHGGMGRTTLVQHIYEDERMKEFDLKIWVCVSNNFDFKNVIADMLEYLDKKKPDLDTLDALQCRLRDAVRGKKFLLILDDISVGSISRKKYFMDDIWVEELNRDFSKWRKVLAPLAYGKFGSRILATTQEDSFAMMIAMVIKKKTEIFRLDDLEEDHFLQFLNSHAFAGLEKSLEDLVIRYLCWKDQNRSKKKAPPPSLSSVGGELGCIPSISESIPSSGGRPALKRPWWKKLVRKFLADR